MTAGQILGAVITLAVIAGFTYTVYISNRNGD
jgi:hypothetical protein